MDFLPERGLVTQIYQDYLGPPGYSTCLVFVPRYIHNFKKIFLMVEKGISVFFLKTCFFFFWTFESTWESSAFGRYPHNWQPGRQPQVYHRLQAIKVLQDRWKTSRFFMREKGHMFYLTLPKFNMEPINGTLEYEIPFGNHHF